MEDKLYNYCGFYCNLYCVVYAKYTKDVYVKLKKISGLIKALDLNLRLKNIEKEAI